MVIKETIWAHVCCRGRLFNLLGLPKELKVIKRNKGLKGENVWGSRAERECQELNGGKFWQSDRSCKDFRLYCLRCLCFSHHGVLSFRIRRLYLRRATLGPLGPYNRKCACMPNLEIWRVRGLLCLSVVCSFLFIKFVLMWMQKGELVYRNAFVSVG